MRWMKPEPIIQSEVSQKEKHQYSRLMHIYGIYTTPRTAAHQTSLSFTISRIAQTHVHCVDDAIQSSRPLSPPSPPALSLFQHRDLFQWVSSSHQVTKILELQLQHQSFQWIFRVDFLYDWLVGSPCCLKDSEESFAASQFKSINSWARSLLYGPTLTSVPDYWKNHSFDCMELCWQSNVSAFEYSA